MNMVGVTDLAEPVGPLDEVFTAATCIPEVTKASRCCVRGAETD